MRGRPGSDSRRGRGVDERAPSGTSTRGRGSRRGGRSGPTVAPSRVLHDFSPGAPEFPMFGLSAHAGVGSRFYTSHLHHLSRASPGAQADSAALDSAAASTHVGARGGDRGRGRSEGRGRGRGRSDGVPPDDMSGVTSSTSGDAATVRSTRATLRALHAHDDLHQDARAIVRSSSSEDEPRESRPGITSRSRDTRVSLAGRGRGRAMPNSDHLHEHHVYQVVSRHTPQLPRSSATVAVGTSPGHDASRAVASAESGEAGESNLRADVGRLADRVWELRGGVDVYTRLPRDRVRNPEVDHVVEVQLHNFVFDRVVRSAPVAAGTRGAERDAYRAIVNAAQHLNVTAQDINKTKEGPFRAFKNRYDAGALRSKTLDECARQTASSSHTMRRMIDEGWWANITRQVVVTWDDMQNEVLHQVRNQAMAQALVDEMTSFIGKMDIG